MNYKITIRGFVDLNVTDIFTYNNNLVTRKYCLTKTASWTTESDANMAHVETACPSGSTWVGETQLAYLDERVAAGVLGSVSLSWRTWVCE